MRGFGRAEDVGLACWIRGRFAAVVGVRKVRKSVGS